MPWCQSAVSKNPNVTWSIVKDNLSYNWDWANLSRNPSIKWSDIKSNPDAPWNWRYVSENPNVSWDIVQQYPDLPWNYDALVTNKMNQAKHDWIQQKRLHTIKALQLQRHWRNYSNNPQYILGKRLVLERAGYEV
jgi:hypothetical protein